MLIFFWGGEKKTYLSELLGGVGEEGADVILHQVLPHRETQEGGDTGGVRGLGGDKWQKGQRETSSFSHLADTPCRPQTLDKEASLYARSIQTIRGFSRTPISSTMYWGSLGARAVSKAADSAASAFSGSVVTYNTKRRFG